MHTKVVQLCLCANNKQALPGTLKTCCVQRIAREPTSLPAHPKSNPDRVDFLSSVIPQQLITQPEPYQPPNRLVKFGFPVSTFRILLQIAERLLPWDMQRPTYAACLDLIKTNQDEQAMAAGVRLCRKTWVTYAQWENPIPGDHPCLTVFKIHLVHKIFLNVRKYEDMFVQLNRWNEINCMYNWPKTT